MKGQGPIARSLNEFSGPGYRIINFIADLPLRLDPARHAHDPAFAEFGCIAFALTEFQVVDEAAAHANEQGENSHEAYKERKRQTVRHRLLTGIEADDEVPD